MIVTIMYLTADIPIDKQRDHVLKDTSSKIHQLQNQIDSLEAEKVNFQKRIEVLIQERDQYTEQVEQQKLQLQQQIEYQKDENQRSKQQLSEKEQQICDLESEKQHYKTEINRLQQQNRELQQKFDSVSESSVSQFTTVQISSPNQDSWNVQRREVILQGKLGQGAWGCVCKGVFRGQLVAVKCAHENILHANTVDQLKREIRIMAHTQHPNLVRLIAAVVDEGVERQTESPLLLLELLDIDARSAYQKKVVNIRKSALLSIFQDVAYALHYLHEHQEPIIHRDVSAPNVLLQQTHPGVWRAKLSDFGSANLAKHCKTAGVGAIIYSAPETFPPRNPNESLPKQTTKIDVFSYGYLLAELIAEEMPSPERRVTILSRISQEWAPMHDIITVCTNYEPAQRGGQQWSRCLRNCIQ